MQIVCDLSAALRTGAVEQSERIAREISRTVAMTPKDRSLLAAKIEAAILGECHLELERRGVIV